MLDLDLHVRREDFDLQVTCALTAPATGIVGPSGAGKTTLLHAIAGLGPARGRIRLGDRTLLDGTRGIPVHRRRIGLVFQDDRLFPHRTVRGNLEFARAPAAAGAPTLDDVVALLELEPMLGRKPGRLSGGERRRVALGRALLSGPELLLLDEPLTGLDPARKRQILPFLRRVRATLDIPLLVVSHDLREVLQLTDELLVLDAGRPLGPGRFVDLALDPGVLPAVRRSGLCNVMPVHRDAEGHRLAGDGPPLHLPHVETDARSFSVAIRPEDVALATGEVPAISIRNRLPGRVRRCIEQDGRVLVEVDVGAPLLVDVTPAAQAQLRLEPGRDVVCLIKSTAIEWLG